MPEHPYPEHQKLKAIKDRSQACGAFLDWLREAKGFVLCEEHEHSEGCYTTGDPEVYGEDYQVMVCQLRQGELIPAHYSTGSLLAEHFDIDQKKLDAEKDDLYTIQLTRREMDVAREWIAYAVTVPSDHPRADQDNETAESVIAKLEALGARGTL